MTVNSSAPVALQALLPDEAPEPGKPPYYPNYSGGRKGAIIQQVAGSTFTDFNLHIPANMVLFTVVLCLTLVMATYRKS
jgi:hypothetical protein